MRMDSRTPPSDKTLEGGLLQELLAENLAYIFCMFTLMVILTVLLGVVILILNS